MNLVKVDGVVTDSDGKLVPDLKAGDFEGLQDGSRLSEIRPLQCMLSLTTADR